MTEQNILKKLLRTNTTRELAKKLNTDPTTISRLSTGKRKATGPLAKLIRILAVWEDCKV